MENLRGIKSSITELPYNEALQLVLGCRSNRRISPTKRKQGRRKKKTDLNKLLAGISSEQASELLDMLSSKSD